MTRERSWKATRSRWYYWEGGFLAVGQAYGHLETHAHHAFQLIVSGTRPACISIDDGPEEEYQGAIIRPNVKHSDAPATDECIVLLVDPDSMEGRLLWRSYTEPIEPLDPERVTKAQAAVRSFLEQPNDAEAAAHLVEYLITLFSRGLLPPRELDHRIAAALEIIKNMGPAAANLEDLAARVHLSPSRFAHLFKENVGLPFGRYVLWRRLSRATVLVIRGNTLSNAAHAAGFSDAAHFSRTFSQMFGVAPSVFLSQGDVSEISAPFEAVRR